MLYIICKTVTVTYGRYTSSYFVLVTINDPCIVNNVEVQYNCWNRPYIYIYQNAMSYNAAPNTHSVQNYNNAVHSISKMDSAEYMQQDMYLSL